MEEILNHKDKLHIHPYNEFLVSGDNEDMFLMAIYFFPTEIYKNPMIVEMTSNSETINRFYIKVQ